MYAINVFLNETVFEVPRDKNEFKREIRAKRPVQTGIAEAQIEIRVKGSVHKGPRLRFSSLTRPVIWF